ncbi:MAG: tetratricopeptide repeat protein [Bacteroidia bacterium]|nr:tetratricopeptide repeat protein [Bacteroidia bacterium]
MSKWFFGFFLLFCLPVYSQQTAVYTDAERTYHTGYDLYSKQKYVAAQAAFEKILSSRQEISLETRGNSEFFAACCAAELFHKDAPYRLLQFMKQYPESPKFQDAVYTLGTYYYRLRQYKKAVEWLAQLDPEWLNGNRKDEVNFRLGYCYYMSGDYDKASKAFFAVKDGDSKYATAAQYYYGHMEYVNGNYETALQSFLKLRDSEAFAPVVPYYITQIYYRQGKYDEVLKYGGSALDSTETHNGLEISRMVAESFFKTGNYREAIPYLLDYEKNSPNAGRDDYYQLGFSYYKTGDYKPAIPCFQKVTNLNDSLSQNAYFLLADCFLKTGDKAAARNAFHSAVSPDLDTYIDEEAQFNYARLSYELSFQSSALEAFRLFIKKYPNSLHINEANELLVSIYESTHNYKDAITALEAIPNKTDALKAATQKVTYYRGLECYLDNKPEDAVQMFTTSLAYPVNQVLVARAWYWKGESFYKMNKFEDAVKAYNEFLYTPAALKLQEYNLANYNIGYCLFKLENYAGAQTAFRKYVSDKPATDNQRLNDANLRIGDCYFMLKNQAGAMEYYNAAIAANAKSADYAIFQKAEILGIQGKVTEKISTLRRIFDKFPKSPYYDDALYEAGQGSLILGKNEQALEYYRKIISDYPNSSYLRKAQLGEALVYFNTRQDDKALKAYKNIVSTYPNTVESREALMQIKNISVSQNRVNEYLDYARSIPDADLSKAAQDSLTYEAAELRYTQGDCTGAVRDFDSYLSSFPDGIFKINAAYYKSDCMFRNKDYDKALAGYLIVIQSPKGPFTEKSLLNAAWIQYRSKDFNASLQNYTLLEKIAEVKDNILAAQAGQMHAAARLQDCSRGMEAAGKVLESGSPDKDLINEAEFITGKCAFASEDFTKAKTAFTIVAKRTNSEMTAESRYYLAVIEYKMGNYKECQKMVFEIQKQVPSYDYWVAKGFILLGDNYLAQKDTFQAKETYKSIVENYQKDPSDPDDLKSIAKEKLVSLITAEQIRDKDAMEQILKNLPVEQDTTN